MNQPLPTIIHESWHEHLQPLFNDNKMELIKKDLLKTSLTYYPERGEIFRVFKMPLDKIKVVCIGQDPYPNGESIGLAFAVSIATKLPPSLRIIKKEVDDNTKLKYFKKHEDLSWRMLQHWANQGVFLLNSALTVERRNAGSHLGQWNWFTRQVVKIIATNNPTIWLLWGAKAKGFMDYIVNPIDFPSYINKEMPISISPSINLVTSNFVLSGNHPAAETYPNSEYPFTSCNHFNIVNAILESKNLEQIKW